MKPTTQSTVFLIRIVSVIFLLSESGLCDLLKPLHRFTFDENSTELGTQIVNAPQKNGIIELNGQHDLNKPPGYRVILPTPELDYQSFTVAVRLKPESKNKETIPLLVGGYLYRWLALTSSASGELALSLNNGEDRQPIAGANLAFGKWTTFVISCDLAAKRVCVFINGERAANIKLPGDFKLEVANSDRKDSDKNWMFTNYGAGLAMKGAVDELVLFDGIVSEKQIAEMCSNPNCITLPGGSAEDRIWTDAATGRTLEGTLQSKSPDGGEVKIKRKDNGSVVPLKSERLLEADREFIKTWKP